MCTGWVGGNTTYHTQTVYDYSIKGRREPILYSVPYSRRCNHDEEALYPSPAIVSARAKASAVETCATRAWFYVAAVVGDRERSCGGVLPLTVQRSCSGGSRWRAEVTEFVVIEHRAHTEAQVRQRAAHQGIEFTRRGDGAAGCDDRLTIVAAPGWK